MDVVPYPDKCKYKYIFIIFNQTAILAFTEENMLSNLIRLQQSLFQASIKKVMQVRREAASESPWSHLAASAILRAEATAFSVNGCNC